MSDYKITVYASAGVDNSATEVIDLVVTWGYTEEKAKKVCETGELDELGEELLFQWALDLTAFEYGCNEDADLIAADAPDIYDVLREAVEACGHPDDLDGWLVRAKMALAKAEGKKVES